jgi:phage protein U
MSLTLPYAILGDMQVMPLWSPSAWRERRGASWAQIPMVGGKPALQRTGSKLIELDLEFELRQEDVVVADVLTALREAEDLGQVLPLILGTGEFLGLFVADEHEVVRSFTLSDGALVGAQVRVKLLEFTYRGPLELKARAPRSLKKGSPTAKTVPGMPVK